MAKGHFVTPELTDAIISTWKLFKKEKDLQKHISLKCPVKRIAQCLEVSVKIVSHVTMKASTGVPFMEAEKLSHNMEVPDDFCDLLYSNKVVQS